MYQSSRCPERASAFRLAHSIVLRSLLIPSRIRFAAALRRARSFLCPASAFLMEGSVFLTMSSYCFLISFSIDSSCPLSLASSLLFLAAVSFSLRSAEPSTPPSFPICLRSAASRGPTSLACQSLSALAASLPSLIALALTLPSFFLSSFSPAMMIVLSSSRSFVMLLIRKALSFFIPPSTLARSWPSLAFCSARSWASVRLMSATSDAIVDFFLSMSGPYLPWSPDSRDPNSARNLSTPDTHFFCSSLMPATTRSCLAVVRCTLASCLPSMPWIVAHPLLSCLRSLLSAVVTTVFMSSLSLATSFLTLPRILLSTCSMALLSSSRAVSTSLDMLRSLWSNHTFFFSCSCL
mmetsp:Transcript_16399/g.41394  ORF Transcript_16399/g.41394 Transcript_16399/m.41394 type:complete len:351 (-) Transcript_16399:136-1188(-)